MEKLGEGLKKLLLAGVGTVATTAEKSKEILEEMVKKGELTVEQGKILNQELKHNIRQTVKEKMGASDRPSTPEEIQEFLKDMTPEELEKLKDAISGLERAARTEETSTGEEKTTETEREVHVGNQGQAEGKETNLNEDGAER